MRRGFPPKTEADWENPVRRIRTAGKTAVFGAAARDSPAANLT
jgi:hypothetical protein